MGRTIDQLPQAVTVNAIDKLVISQDGISKKADQSQVGGGGGGPPGPSALLGYAFEDFVAGVGVPWDTSEGFGTSSVDFLVANDALAAEAFGVLALVVGGGFVPSQAKIRLGVSPAGPFRGELSPAFEARVFIADPSSATFEFGGDGAGGQAGLTSCLFTFSEGGSQTWRCVTASVYGGFGVDFDTLVPVGIGWVTLRIEVDRDFTQARYYIDGALVYTETDLSAVPQANDAMTVHILSKITINYFNPTTTRVDWVSYSSLRSTPQ